MRLTLLESDRSFFRSAEYATVSIVTHVGVVWLVLTTSTGTFRLPTTEREAKVLFLLPPDPVDATKRQTEIFIPERPGSGLDQAGQLPTEGEGRRLVATEPCPPPGRAERRPGGSALRTCPLSGGESL